MRKPIKHMAEIMTFLALIGVVLSFSGFKNGDVLGRCFYNTTQAGNEWTLAPYVTPSGQFTYSFFGMFMLWGSGFVMGLAIPVYKQKRSIPMFLGSTAGTALSFNTLDWMLAGPIYDLSQTEGYPSAWSFYFFQIVAFLWVGGFMLGLAAALFWQR